MTQIEASAPGKLVWLGEYAVLEGAPALVVAVDRRARVRLVDGDADRPAREAERAGRPNGGNGWHVEPALLSNVASLLDCPVAGGVRAEVDTDRLFTEVSQTRVKLGLGSSAALTVAMAGALCALDGRPALGVDTLVAAHRRGQDGRGSGVDVAAALHGGAMVYRRAGESARCDAVRLPEALRWCCVWTGRPASTNQLLARMGAWREDAPRRHASAMQALEAVAEAGVAAVARGDAGGLVAAMRACGGQLAQLSDASGVDIACSEHRAIGAIADACGVAYKSCGAGGGDVGVAVATDSLALDAFKKRATSEGWQVLDLAADTHGLETRVRRGGSL